MKPVIANILFFSRHKTDLMGANRYFSAPVNVNSFELLCDHAAQIEASTVQGRPVLDPFPTQAGVLLSVSFRRSDLLQAQAYEASSGFSSRAV